MIAFLMAAGNGMRLRPITNDINKCLLPVFGKPILEWWLDACFEAECFSAVYVNLHYLAEKMNEWLADYSRRKRRIVHRIDERGTLLGTAGTLFYHADFTDDFMIAYTDTFSRDVFNDLPRIVNLWERVPHNILAGLLSFDCPKDRSSGVIVTDENGHVEGFSEKKGKEGPMAWAGVMFGRPDFLGELRATDHDLASDVFPRIAKKMKVLKHVDAYDIGRGVDYYEQLVGKSQTPRNYSG